MVLSLLSEGGSILPAVAAAIKALKNREIHRHRQGREAAVRNARVLAVPSA